MCVRTHIQRYLNYNILALLLALCIFTPCPLVIVCLYIYRLP